jgi:hypothetical protein
MCFVYFISSLNNKNKFTHFYLLLFFPFLFNFNIVQTWVLVKPKVKLFFMHESLTVLCSQHIVTYEYVTKFYNYGEI